MGKAVRVDSGVGIGMFDAAMGRMVGAGVGVGIGTGGGRGVVVGLGVGGWPTITNGGSGVSSGSAVEGESGGADDWGAGSCPQAAIDRRQANSTKTMIQLARVCAER